MISIDIELIICVGILLIVLIFELGNDL